MSAAVPCSRFAKIAALLAAILGGAGLQPARAGEAEREAVRTVLFGGFDAGSSSFVSAGAKHAFEDVNASGVLLMGGAGYGARFERDHNGPHARWGLRPPLVVRHTMIAHAMAGHQWSFDWGVVQVFAGPEIAYEYLASPYAGRREGPRLGGRVHGEVWARPTDETLLTLTAIAGSARTDVWSRASLGYRLWGVYLGPETALYADRTGYRKWTAGLHATGLELRTLTIRVSAGWLYEERARRTGAYVALSLWRPL